MAPPTPPSAPPSSDQPRPRPRPLSPHLQVYRLPIPALMSISHRITGVALVAGSLLLVAWLFAAATGPDAFAWIGGLLSSIVGQIILFLWSLALFYHLFNGIRHLWWDAGRGLELAEAYHSGWLTLAAALILTVAMWLIALLV